MILIYLMILMLFLLSMFDLMDSNVIEKYLLNLG